MDVAEAYWLASLLQLRQTFPDVNLLRKASVGSTNAASELLQLALAISRILEKIPTYSNTHSIQPLPHLSASTQLRFGIEVPAQEQSPCQADDIYSPDLHETISESRSDWGSDIKSANFVPISEVAIEVGHARRFVFERLGVLEKRLPSKPIEVVKELVQELWAGYDGEELFSSEIHWIDLMLETGLQTIFGSGSK